MKDVKTIMYVALQIAADCCGFEPLPFTSAKLKKILNVISSEAKKYLTWNEISTKEVLLASGHKINKQELLFSKIEDKIIEVQLEKLATTKLANEQANKAVEPQKETIEFEDFTKLDIRVGTILEAQKVPKQRNCCNSK